MIPQFIAKSQIPHKPGIYIYRNLKGDLIYVGKAVDLFSRVGSYFSGRPTTIKVMHLVREITDVETVIVESEIEALILEANLIKKFKPLFNIRLTDDKDYLYIALTNEEFPKVITARKQDLKLIKHWFGPFPSSTIVKQTLKQLRKVFPWCSKPPKIGIASSPSASRNDVIANAVQQSHKLRPCFYYHINQCPGACIGKISGDAYLRIIARFKKFMDGKKEELKEDLIKEMENHANNQEFEQANRIKKILTGIEYITAPTKVAQYLTNPNFIEDLNRQALMELQKDLSLSEPPERIEAYDISNIAGKDASGSMVVLTNGEIDKSQYRRFKIKITGKPNDYAMHAEMIRRRLGHPEWGTPQLILIDGGRGQVRAVIKAMQQSSDQAKEKNSKAASLHSSIASTPIFGLAKRMEWLYPPEGEVIKLPKRNLSLRLLQKIRDESHRFAFTYHKKLRERQFLGNS